MKKIDTSLYESHVTLDINQFCDNISFIKLKGFNTIDISFIYDKIDEWLETTQKDLKFIQVLISDSGGIFFIFKKIQ